jgi:hypothetical protein
MQSTIDKHKKQDAEHCWLYIIALSQQQEIKVKLRMLQTSISNVSRRFSTGNDRRYLNKINIPLYEKQVIETNSRRGRIQQKKKRDGCICRYNRKMANF